MYSTQKPIHYLFKAMPEENDASALINKIDLKKADFPNLFSTGSDISWDNPS